MAWVTCGFKADGDGTLVEARCWAIQPFWVGFLAIVTLPLGGWAVANGLLILAPAFILPLVANLLIGAWVGPRQVNEILGHLQHTLEAR